nr:hypothetical protein [Dictyobacter kobayashii]
MAIAISPPYSIMKKFTLETIGAAQSIMDEAQPFKRQILVDILNFGNDRCHLLCHPSMGNDLNFALMDNIWYLFADTCDETLDKSDMAIDDT